MAEPRETMLSIGECPVCRTGPLGLRVCGECGQVVVLCDECDAVWRDGRTDTPPEPLPEGALPCPDCGASLTAPGAHWASLEEAHATAWVSAAVASGECQLTEVAALQPKVNESPADELDDQRGSA